MLKPSKYMDIDLSIINQSSIILRLLINSEVLKYNKLLSMIVKEQGQNAKQSFPLSLSFLFLLGKIEYNPISDELAYIK